MTKDAVKLEIVESAVAGDSPYDADGDGQLSGEATNYSSPFGVNV